MKKFSLVVFILISMIVLMLNFTSCKKLSQDVLQANGHLSKANALYGKENFKGAVKEYEEAIKKNPELKKLNLELYIASCYSSLYKANVQPPENQELLAKVKDNAQVLYQMKKQIPPPEEGEVANEVVNEFKKIAIKNVGNEDGLVVINDFLNNEENGLSGMKDLAGKFIEKEKEIYAITNTYSPLIPDYRLKLEENVFNNLKIKELKEYIDSNSDADDLDVKQEEIDSINAKIIENNDLIESTYVKNKDFYAKRKKNIELKKSIAVSEEYAKAFPVEDIPVEKGLNGKVVKYKGIYDYLGTKIIETKTLEVNNREMTEYFSKKDEIGIKTTELDAKNQTLEAMENYEEVNSKIEKRKENNKEIIRLKSETIELVEKKDDAEGELITNYSEKYDVFTERLIEDIENNAEIIKIQGFLKTVKGYDTALAQINSDENYLKLIEDIKTESAVISNNNKVLDTVKDLEEIKLKITEFSKYSKLLTESETFLSSVKDLDQIIEKYKANELLKADFIAEQKNAEGKKGGDVSGTLSRFGKFEYDNIDITKKESAKKKIVLTEKGKELKKQIDINKKYFSKIKGFEKIIETNSQIENYKNTVKSDKEYLDKIEKLEEIKVKVTENQASELNIDKKISEKKNIAKKYLKKLKNNKEVIVKFEKIIDLQNKGVQNASFYAISEGFADFKIKFDEMVGFQKSIDSNGVTQELLSKENTDNDKIISENENFKALSKLIHERDNFKYKIKSNKEYIAMIEKKYKKGEPESRYELTLTKYYADMKKIEANKLALDSITEKHPDAIVKYKAYESMVKEEIGNKNYFEKAIKNEIYKNDAIDNLLNYINDEKNSEDDKRKALTLLSDIYKKIAQSAPDETTKGIFFEKTKACYEELLKESGDDKNKKALALYSKAKFYSEFGKEDIAKQQYIDRIALDPYVADGYYYLANYLQERAQYSEAIENHKKRIYALIDKANGNHNIMDEVIKIDGLKEKYIGKNVSLETREQYIKNVGKNAKYLTGDAKLEFEKKRQGLEDYNKYKVEFVASFKTIIKDSYEAYKNIDVKSIDKKLREELAKAFYTVGVVYWTSTYRTDAEEMHPAFRLSVIDSGFNVLDESIRLDANYPEPWSYKALLWVQMKKVNPEKREEYTLKNKDANKVFVRLLKKRAELKRFEEAQKKV